LRGQYHVFVRELSARLDQKRRFLELDTMNTALIKKSGWVLMLVGAGIVFVYAIVFYLALGLDSAPDELEESFKARSWGIYIHIIGAMFALTATWISIGGWDVLI
jgi:hypothetical protein